MARIDNLSNFLTDVADSIRSKTGKSEAITPADYDTEIESISSGASLQEKSINISANDNYTLTPDENYDGMSQVDIHVNVPGEEPVLQNKIANPSTSQQIVEADSNYDGLASVTINAIQTESKYVKSTTTQQTITPTAGKFIDQVVVNPITLENITIRPTTSSQVITPSQNKDGINQVNVNAVDSTIDSNIKPSNIKKGVSILNVAGNYDPTPNLQSKETTIIESPTTLSIWPDMGYDGLSNVVVNVDVQSGYPPDWRQIDYYETPQKIIDDFNYAKQIYDNWDFSQTDLFEKFRADGNLVYMPLVYTGNVTNMTQMFYECSQLAYVPSLDTSNVRSMEGMFYNCSSIKAIPELYTPNVTTMRKMFMDCTSLEYVPMLDTDNVSNMEQMFYNCNKLSDESLYHILEMCIRAQNVWPKTLSRLSLTNEQMSRCQTLSNWQDFLNAGWTA